MRILVLILVVASGELIEARYACAAQTPIIAEGHYVMADGDTLAVAEERVLQRAQRRAVEEAGVYLESTFRDFEKSTKSENVQSSSLEIRTLAAAITRTEVLESRRSFENERPNFFVKIRAFVNLDNLQDAIRRWKSEQQYAEHFRQLQRENAQLKAQLQELRAPPTGVRMLVIEPPGRNGMHERARTLVDEAVASHDLKQKIDLTSQAAVLDPQSADPLIVRGQTYLRLISIAYSNKAKPSEYSRYIDNARMDFDRALIIDPKNTWALLGQGDVNTWLERPDESTKAYEQALELNPFFDVARHRLINLHTTRAKKLMAEKQWSHALELLSALLQQPGAEGWVAYEKEAFLLRSEIYQQLNQPAQAIHDLGRVLEVDPSNTTALLTRAKLHREQLQERSAKDDFEQACLLGSTRACEQLP